MSVFFLSGAATRLIRNLWPRWAKKLDQKYENQMALRLADASNLKSQTDLVPMFVAKAQPAYQWHCGQFKKAQNARNLLEAYLGPDRFLLDANMGTIGSEEAFIKYLSAYDLNTEFWISLQGAYFDDVAECVTQKAQNIIAFSRHPKTLSVVLTVYNSENTLDASIASLVQQTFKGFKIIAVDDASTDRSLEILKKWQNILGKENFEIIVHDHNKGVAAAKNSALKAIETEYVAFQDSDDVSLPERFENQIQQFKLDKDIVVVSHLYLRLSVKDNLSHPFFSYKLWPYTRWSPNSSMYRVGAIGAEMRFNETLKIGEDTDFFERIKNRVRSKQMIKISKPLFLSAYRKEGLMALYGESPR